MEFVSFLPFMAVSTPESFVLYYMGSAVIGYQPSLKKLIAAALVTSLISYFIRSMPILFGVHTLIHVIVLVIIFTLGFKIPPLLSVVTTFIAGFLLGLTESTILPLLGWILGFTIKEIVSDPFLRFSFGMPHLIVLAGAAYGIRSKGWYLISLKKALTKEKRGRELGHARKFYLFTISLLQALMLIFLNLNFYAYRAGLFPTLKLSHLIFITSAVIFASAGTTVFVANRLVHITNREAKLEVEINHIREMQNLNLKMRSQRHDFYNLITSLYGFIRSGRYDDAKQYMESLYQDIKKVKEILAVEPPALGALISLKRDKTEKLGVDFCWEINFDRAALPLSIQELTQVLGNLLDNAIEAASSAEHKIVKLFAEHSALGLILNVTNSSQPVTLETMDRLFQPGFSTKNTGEHSGLGMYIVQEIVNRHNGQIQVSEPENYRGLEIEIFIPDKSAP